MSKDPLDSFPSIRKCLDFVTANAENTCVYDARINVSVTHLLQARKLFGCGTEAALNPGALALFGRNSMGI